MSYFKVFGQFGFHLQDAYIEGWVNNTMIFLEMDDLDDYLKSVQKLNPLEKYAKVRLSSIKESEWR